MSRPVDKLLQSIKDDFAVVRDSQRALDALEARSLFRLLNYCPPPAPETGEPHPPSKDHHGLP